MDLTFKSALIKTLMQDHSIEQYLNMLPCGFHLKINFEIFVETHNLGVKGFIGSRALAGAWLYRWPAMRTERQTT